MNAEQLAKAKSLGFSDRQIAPRTGHSQNASARELNSITVASTQPQRLASANRLGKKEGFDRCPTESAILNTRTVD
jgi:hypothetical protein